VRPRQPHARQSAVLPRWPHQTDFPADRAVDFLAETIEANPGEVTLLAIGPMTNVAVLFRRFPETARQLKRLALMIGRYGPEQIGTRPAEWNAYCDPHAAEDMFQANPNNLRASGLDVTTKVRMDASEVRRRFQVGLLRPVLDMAEVWFSEREHITFHDPLAAVTIFQPGICSFERGTVSVDTTDSDSQGTTRWESSHNGPHEVAVTVDSEQFFRAYFEVFNA
jgi:purine nucleosidase